MCVCMCIYICVYVYVYVYVCVYVRTCFSIFSILFARSFYTEPILLELLGVESSIAIDIALSLGLTESIVETIYSVMKSQSMPGGQDNGTLALRL